MNTFRIVCIKKFGNLEIVIFRVTLPLKEPFGDFSRWSNFIVFGMENTKTAATKKSFRSYRSLVRGGCVACDSPIQHLRLKEASHDFSTAKSCTAYITVPEIAGNSKFFAPLIHNFFHFSFSYFNKHDQISINTKENARKHEKSAQ